MVADLRPVVFDIYDDLWGEVGEVMAPTHLPRHAQAATSYTCLGKASNPCHARRYARHFAENRTDRFNHLRRENVSLFYSAAVFGR
jgi:hypothetical protein